MGRTPLNKLLGSSISYRFYTRDMQERDGQRLTIERELCNALKSLQLTLYYQPQLCIGTGKSVGLEALVRWNHPSQGLILPGAFLPLAADSHLMEKLGDWVMNEACRQVGEWIAAGFMPPPIALNVTPEQLNQKGFRDRFLSALAKYGVPPAQLRVEITESYLGNGGEKTTEIFRGLRSRGIKVALYGFGTGFLSLDKLPGLPIDILKIDRAFVAGLPTDGASALIVELIIKLSRMLQVEVIAEGVEHGEQLQHLWGAGCHQVQGFYYQAALHPVELITWLEGKERAAAYAAQSLG